MESRIKSQSAMEYLMTYGWAILIIAVVLGALYSLGLFNGSSLAPRASPGACQVYRPNGPGTTQYISLQGACTNLMPQYTAQFSGSTSYIKATNPIGTNPWYIYFNNYGSDDVDAYISTWGRSTIVTPLNTWSSVCFSYNGGTGGLSLYVDGALGYSGTQSGSYSISVCAWIYPQNGAAAQDVASIEDGTSTMGIASRICCGFNYFTGGIANLQIYNTSLDPNAIKAIYQSGIGGAPINLQNLAGWWPLNGNANDYSGNLNNGQPISVTYTNQWLSGYTVP